MKFRNGQRVRLLKGAWACDGVNKRDIGKEGILIESDILSYLRVKMTSSSHSTYWYVSSNNIELVPTKGEQLLFDFMRDN